MNKKIVILLTMVLSLVFTTTIFAKTHDMKQEDSQCKYMQYKEHMKKIEDKLNLTDEQKKQIASIKSDKKNQMKVIYTKMKDLRTQMKDLVMSETMDEDKMNAIINEKKKLVGEKTKIKLQAKNKMYNVLTPEQKTKFSSMMDKWEQKKMEADTDDNSDND